jgi:glutaredoxin
VRVARRALLAVLLAGCGGSPVPVATAAERARVEVVMYTTSWCGVCARARHWFQLRGIPFEERDVERDPYARSRHRRLNPRGSVPTLDIEGRIIVGYDGALYRETIDRAAARHRSGG